MVRTVQMQMLTSARLSLLLLPPPPSPSPSPSYLYNSTTLLPLPTIRSKAPVHPCLTEGRASQPHDLLPTLGSMPLPLLVRSPS